MQVLTANCPYCQHEVDSTIENLDGPIICPACHKPFEMAIPTAAVMSVHQVDERAIDKDRMAVESQERVLVKVHPVVFRARPIASLGGIIVGLTALSLLVMSLSGVSLWGYSFSETIPLGPASLLTWLCAITLFVVACIIGYWTVQSRFTTLTVTDERTIYQKGVISRERSEVQHVDVRNLQLDQSFMQRLLKVGGVGISSSGQDDLEIVATRLLHPEQIIDYIRKNQN